MSPVGVGVIDSAGLCAGRGAVYPTEAEVISDADWAREMNVRASPYTDELFLLFSCEGRPMC